MGRVVLLALTPVLALTACMSTGPDARRAAYLRCARDQGVPVRDGTIVSRGPEDLARLDACEAIPR
ncbi:hypothetical protein [uncultured Jannaschia sp.]|uniref:hypothetical protein n=1 Tax=uncultured Jannaschia sp. TaxID=293347 RepID=UPI00261271D1|nr:hypothetical protein [uncultured Jannaschia sp.]